MPCFARNAFGLSLSCNIRRKRTRTTLGPSQARAGCLGDEGYLSRTDTVGIQYVDLKQPKCRHSGVILGEGQRGKNNIESNPAILQLDCPSVTSWDLVGTTSYIGPILNLIPFLDSSAQTTRGNELDFFVNTKNGLV